jgi:hypothetical protein
VEDQKLNTTWGDDSDSDSTLFKDMPFKSRIVKIIRSKLLPPTQAIEPKSIDLDVEAVSVPISDLKKMCRLADSVATLDILQVCRLTSAFANYFNFLFSSGHSKWPTTKHHAPWFERPAVLRVSS